MSEKIYVRKCERYTIWESSKPVEVDVEKLRKCEPPYDGDSPEELLTYLNDHVFNNYDWSETNGEVYGEDQSYDLTLDDVETEVYSDTREKYAEDWLDVGVPNDEWRKMGGFEVFASTVE